MKTQELNQIIRSVDDPAVLREVIDVGIEHLKDLEKRQARDIIRTLKPGDCVQVTGQLAGNAYHGQKGTVEVVKKTRVGVKFAADKHGRTLDSTYHPTVLIPASHLSKAEW